MRLFLLLSAFLTTLVGPLGATSSAAQVTSAACAIDKRAAVQAVRAHVRIVATLPDERRAAPATLRPIAAEAPALPVARYVLRLRV